MTTNIIVNLQVEALHKWEAAKEVFPEVGFLADLHRHIFHISCKKRVNHDDRDVEFILFKRKIIAFLSDEYYDEDLNIHNFNGMSCEMIARHLVSKFDLCYCSVMEDNENGAEVIR